MIPPVDLNGMRHAAREDEDRGHFLQATYLREGAAEIQVLRGYAELLMETIDVLRDFAGALIDLMPPQAQSDIANIQVRLLKLRDAFLQKDVDVADVVISLSQSDLDLIRQWFDAVQEANPQYLERRDFELAARIHLGLGHRVPTSVTRHLEQDDDHG